MCLVWFLITINHLKTLNNYVTGSLNITNRLKELNWQSFFTPVFEPVLLYSVLYANQFYCKVRVLEPLFYYIAGQQPATLLKRVSGFGVFIRILQSGKLFILVFKSVNIFQISWNQGYIINKFHHSPFFSIANFN